MQGSNPHLLHGQEDSLPMSPGKPLQQMAARLALLSPGFSLYEMETEASASWDGFGERKSALAQHMVWLCFGIAILLRSEEIQR